MAASEVASSVGEAAEGVVLATRFLLPVTAGVNGLLRATARPAILLGVTSQPM